METFGYLTDVLTSFRGMEQRVQLRAVPVGTIAYSVLLDDLRDAQMAGAILFGNQARAFGIGRWQFRVPLAQDAVPDDLEVLCDTADIPFEPGGLVLLWADPVPVGGPDDRERPGGPPGAHPGPPERLDRRGDRGAAAGRRPALARGGRSPGSRWPSPPPRSCSTSTGSGHERARVLPAQARVVLRPPRLGGAPGARGRPPGRGRPRWPSPSPPASAWRGSSSRGA